MEKENELLRQVQLKIVDIMVEIDKLCREHNIVYYLAYGTAIGAVRHKGFIPWDDDADLIMDRENYERFVEVCKKELSPKFFLQTEETDPEYKLVMPKVRMNNTSFVEKVSKDWNINHGIYVDIFIIDECPNNKFIQYVNKRVLCGTEFARSGLYTCDKNPVKKILKPLFYKRTILNLWNNVVYDRWKKDDSLCVDNTGRGLVFKREYFGKPREMEFEGHKFYVPEKVEDFLTDYYGDYMQLPPEDKRVSHHSIIHIDLDKSYKK